MSIYHIFEMTIFWKIFDVALSNHFNLQPMWEQNDIMSREELKSGYVTFKT